MSGQLPWRYRIVPACWEWERFDAGWTDGGMRALRALVSWHRGHCAVCGAQLGGELDVDTDPDARLVRGLLCRSCAGAESRSEAKVFRSYRRLPPTTLLGVAVSSAVVHTEFWRRRKAHLLRPPVRHETPDSPEPRGRHRIRRLVLDMRRPERFRTWLRRAGPDREAAERIQLALWHAWEEVEQYAAAPGGVPTDPRTDQDQSRSQDQSRDQDQSQDR